MARPRGVTKPPVLVENPVKITDEQVMEFVNARAENIHNSPTLIKTAKADRDYLMGIFSLIYKRYEGLLIDKKVQGDRRYSPKQMFETASKYIEVTIEHGQPLTITQLGIFLGIRRKDVFRFLNENKFGKEEKFIYDFCDFIESYNEYAAHKKMNPAGPIFILKNFGWKDKFEVEASAKQGALTDTERREAQKRIAGFSEIVKPI